MVGLWIAYTFFRTGKTDEVVFSIGAGTEEIRFVKKLIEEFETKHPAIKVVLNVLPAPTDQQHHYYITTLGAKNKDIDVMRIDTIWIAEFASAGWLESLGKYIDKEDRASFIPVTEKTNVFQDNLYAIPWNANVGLLYYRKDLLEKYNMHPPNTWEELIEICTKISASESIYGYLWQGKQYEGLVCNFVEFIGSNNGGIIDDAGRIIVDAEQNKIALNLMRDLIWEYRISPQNTYSELAEESSRHLFQQGKGLFLRNWTYVWELCQKDPSMKGKVGVSQLPKFSDGKPASVYGGWHLAINAYSKKKERAWQLINFLTSYETQKELAIDLSWLPSRKALYKDPELLEKLPFLPVVESALQDVQIRPNVPYYQWISDVLQKHVNKALSNQTSSEEALSSIKAKLEGIKRDFTEN
ncbi:MAG: ABC transporter substrate-binding protein [Planctomycetes bacterium]|nr:ABC transporter substrate-binding protein [Planctomycetota bacterium]